MIIRTKKSANWPVRCEIEPLRETERKKERKKERERERV